MLPWGRGWRNFGWYCKGCKGHFGGGVQLYECSNCGPNPASEYCLNCASNAYHWKCPNYGCDGTLRKG